jgi:hypothetical protein
LKSNTYTAINHPLVSLVWSYYISILDDIGLKSEISEKCHKTDRYYYQIDYDKCGFTLGLAPTVFDVQFQDQSRLLNASVSSPFSRCPCLNKQTQQLHGNITSSILMGMQNRAESSAAAAKEERREGRWELLRREKKMTDGGK